MSNKELEAKVRRLLVIQYEATALTHDINELLGVSTGKPRPSPVPPVQVKEKRDLVVPDRDDYKGLTDKEFGLFETYVEYMNNPEEP